MFGGQIFFNMKTILKFSFLVFFSATTLCQGQQVTTAPAPTPYTIISRDANSRVWERTTYDTLPSGKTVSYVHSYTELGTGLCYKQNGRWVDSQEQINIQPDGTASATNGQHQVYFPVDIGNNVIKLVTSDGLVLQSQPLGLSYDDGINTVLIAELTNSVGQLISSNQVIYTNAFVGLDADLLYTYRKSGLEQDVIFRKQPPTPEEFGLNPADTRLQMLTEFFNPPTPDETVGPVNPQDQLQDTTLGFGAMEMVQGRAFLVGADQNQAYLHNISVYKSWVNVDGRTLLIEQVPYQRISSDLTTLPASLSRTKSSARFALCKMSSKRLLPARRMAKTTTNAIQVAQAHIGNSGLVFDYVTIGSNQTNFTFQGDTTYYTTYDFFIKGTTTLEGGTVIKMNFNGYTTLGSIVIAENGTINCETASYRPAVFTSWNDNSVGESISGNSGSPYYQDVGTFLYIYPTNVCLHDLRFCYAWNAIQCEEEPNSYDIWDSQFLNVVQAVNAYDIGLYNDLICYSADEASDINGQQSPELLLDGNLVAENVTSDSGYAFINADNSGEVMALTNCLITSQMITNIDENGATLLTNAVIYLPSPTAPVYQVVGGGNYYLANGSSYRNFGTTNINPPLLGELRQKTTYPPLLFSNETFFTNFIFSPQALRDTNTAVDLGYHYDPLDYLCGGVCISNANVTVEPGTAIGCFEMDTFTNAFPYGLDVEGGGQYNSQAIVNNPNRIVGYNTVQEGPPQTSWALPNSGPFYLSDFEQSSPVGAVFSFRFTDFSGFAQDDYLWAFARKAVFSATNSSSVYFRDCESYSGSAYSESVNVTNCLFDRAQTDFEPVGFAWVYNNLIYGGTLTVDYLANSPTSAAIVNNLFDMPLTSVYFPFSQPTNGGYNAYYWDVPPRTNTYFQNAILLTNAPVFQAGPFGNFYQPSNSITIHAGNTNANLLGLYHYTVTTNEVVEGTNLVSIGYHYVATDQYGNPLDSNGDGIPDYLEDAAGNGSGDWDTTLLLNVIITQPRNGSTLP
jgi:hypothetical protein